MKILREYLKLCGMPQTELARRCGINPTNLNHLMQGRIEPGPKMLKRISEATGITIDRLVESATV